ncbi:flavodoxin [Erwinia sp. CPCC 100877]|nr:flavodoxin [Erwinia sp. CPCC 100877]
MPVVVYFSRAEENLIDGKILNLTCGNTKILAEKIACRLNCPAYPLEPVVSYPKNYEKTLVRAEMEKNRKLLPEIKPVPYDFTNEPVIFLGFPTWWGAYPLVIDRFLKQLPLAGKQLYPFCTHEGSGFGDSIAILKKQYSTASIKTGLPVRGSRVLKADEAVKNWLGHYYCTLERK